MTAQFIDLSARCEWHHDVIPSFLCRCVVLAPAGCFQASPVCRRPRQQLADDPDHERAILFRGEAPGRARAHMRFHGRSGAGASGSVASAPRSFRLLLLANASDLDSPPLYRAVQRQAYVAMVQKRWARDRYVNCRVIDPPIGLRFFPVRSHEVIVVLQWWFRNRWEARLQS